MIPRSVLASVSASVDYSVPLNKGTLTKLSLIASGVICTENSSEYEIMKEYMQVQTTEGYSVMIKLYQALTRAVVVSNMSLLLYQ